MVSPVFNQAMKVENTSCCLVGIKARIRNVFTVLRLWSSPSKSRFSSFGISSSQNDLKFGQQVEIVKATLSSKFREVRGPDSYVMDGSVFCRPEFYRPVCKICNFQDMVLKFFD